MAHRDGTAQVRDAATMEAIGASLRLPHAVLSVAWSPDSTMLLTGGVDGTAQVWSARTRLPISQPMVHKGPVSSVAFSPDSQTVLTGSTDEARLWDAVTGKPIGPPLDQDAPVTAVGFSPEGDVVKTRTETGIIRGWRLEHEAIGSDERFILWIQVLIGSEMEPNGLVHGLDATTWMERRVRLESLGGPPLSGRSAEVSHELAEQ